MSVITNQEEMIKRLIDDELVQVYTSIPCRITSFSNVSERYVNVIPLINIVYADGTTMARGEIVDVPLQGICTATTVIDVPVNVGDCVLCVFSMRDIANFKESEGEELPPETYRWFRNTDAIAIPGVYPKKIHPRKKFTARDNTSLSIAHNIGTAKESYIQIKDSGDISVNAKGNVDVTTTAETTVTATKINLNGQLFINGAPYVGHTHTSSIPGTPTSGVIV